MGRVHRDPAGSKDQGSTKRRSLRSSVRKVKIRRSESESPIDSEAKTTRKRKAVRYEDDPSYSEEEEGDANMEKQKKVPGYRCSAILLRELMDNLSVKQKAWVKKIGFGSLQNMLASRSPKSLTMWLIDLVDTKNGSIEVCGVLIDIRKRVKGILNLPSGDKKVPQPLNGRSKAKIPKVRKSGKDEKHSEHGRGQTAKEAMKVVLAENEDEEAFCQSFIMLVLCIYLAPTTSLNINRNYYTALLDVSQIAMMDWCGFIADYLIKGIEEYRRSGASHVQVPGCVHLLPLIYIDALIQLKALKLPESLTLPEGEPRIHFIDSDHLAFLASSDVSVNKKDRIEYGLLQKNLVGSRAGGNETPIDEEEKIWEESVGDDVDQPNSCYEGNAMRKADELLDSLFRDIVAGREKLVQEFQRKIVVSEHKTFGRFKKIFLRSLTSFEKNDNRGKNNNAPGPCSKTINPQDGGCEDGNNSKQSTGRKSTSVEDQNNAPQEIPGKVADIWEREMLVPSIENEKPSENLDSGNEGAGNGEVRTWQSMEKVSEQTSPKSLQGGLKLKDQPRSIDISSHIGKDSAGLLNCPGLEPNSGFDELAEAVDIGKEAAKEATLINESEAETMNDRFRLSILSEAAITGAPPFFESSPATHVKLFVSEKDRLDDNSMDWQLNSSSAFGQQNEKDSRLTTPIYDKSPATPQIDSARQTEHLTTLLPIPEIAEGRGTAREGPVPAGLFQAGDQKETSVGSFDDLDLIGSKNETELPKRTAETTNSAASDETNSSESIVSDSEDQSNSTDIPSLMDDDACYKDPLKMTPNFELTPSFTYDTQEPIDLDALTLEPPRDDIIHIPPLEMEIESGFRFRLGCSVSSSTGKLFQSFNNYRTCEGGMQYMGIFKIVLSKDASETYKNHVSNSTARISTRFRTSIDNHRARTKIQIKGFHVTKGEFVDALKPNGEVSKSLMGLCAVAIMCDWENNKRAILDQSSIKELMKEGHECNHNKVAARLLKLSVQDLEEIFLPMLTANHWILGVVNVGTGKVDLYDSLFVVNDGDDPHKLFWKNVAENLERAYCHARRKTVAISFFQYKYAKTSLQTNSHDCGFHVIQNLECYKTEDLVGYGKKKTMMPFRKYLSHVLVYHRFNDLNPLREGLHSFYP